MKKTLQCLLLVFGLALLLSGLGTSAFAEGEIYRHWNAETGAISFDSNPVGGTAITALNNLTLLPDGVEKDAVKKIMFACDVPVTSGNSLFSDFVNLSEIKGLLRLDVSAVTDMSNMFSGCSGLTELNLGGFDTAAVTDMSGMFSGCSGLT